MICIKCKSQIDDDSIFCKLCGKKQVTTKSKTIRRANGTGTIYKLQGNRRKPWALRVSRMNCGKLERTIVGTFETKREAVNAMAKIDSCSVDYSHKTVTDYYESYLNNKAKSVSESSLAMYKYQRKYIESIGHIQMSKIKSGDIQRVLDDMAEKGLSKNYINTTKSILVQMCNEAMKNDVIDKNYASLCNMPQDATDKVQVKDRFTDEEIAKFKSLADNGNEDAQIVVVLIYTGFRINELFNMKTEDVNLNERYFVGGSKTQAGKNRVVPIGDNIYPYISNWVGKCQEYLLTKDGVKRNARTYRQYGYANLLESLGIRYLSPHCCRHTFASLLAKAGVDERVMTEMMGHADMTMINNVYAHTDIEQLQSAISKIC